MGRCLSRRGFLKSAGAAAPAILSMKAWSEAAPAVVTRGKTGPEWFNVLVVKSDEHNPFFSSLSRHSFVETPNMRRLAERGVVFENTYCPSPLCSPCRSSFASGLRVHRIQRYNNCTIPFANHPCYGRILAENGVHSVHAGKADFYNKTATLGFNEMLSPGDRGGCDGSISRNPLAIREDGASRASGFGVREENLAHDTKRTDEALAWLRETGAKLDRPWTLDLNLVKPHFPHFVSQELWDHYADHEDLPQYGREVETAQHPFAQDLRAHFQTDQFTESQTRGLRRGYYGCVAFIDRQLGRVLDVLEETGLSERTIVAYTSDHGEMLGKFGMWWKCSLYEDSARVPLIVAGPGFGRGKTVHTPVDLLDLQATLFRATGRDSARPPEWVGRPLQDIPDHDPSRVVFSEYHGHGTRASGYLIRKGDWKLLYNIDAPRQLFNLRDDPDELDNRADKRTDKVAELEAGLRAICDPERENRRADEYILRQLAEIKVEGGRSRAGDG